MPSRERMRTRRESVREFQGAFRLPLVVALFVLSIGVDDVSAQAVEQRAVFPPVSDDLQSLWEKIDGFAGAKNWEAVLDGLREYDKILEKSERKFVTSNGSTLSLGSHRIFSIYAEQLPAGYANRLISALDARLESEWNQSDTALFSRERELLRWKIIRDYPTSKFFGRALREDLEVALLNGFWARGRERARQILKLARPTNPAVAADPKISLSIDERARLALIILDADRTIGDDLAFQADAEAFGPLLKEPDLSPNLNELIGRAQRAAQSPVAPVSASTGSSLTFEPTGSQGPKFRLGGVIWRSTNRSVELRSFVKQRASGKDGGSRPFAHVPIPYHPARLGSNLVMQRRDRLSAYDTAAGRERWTILLDGDHDALTTSRVPLVDAQQVYAAHGASITAVDLETGDTRWTARVQHSREDSRLLLTTGDDEPTKVEGGDIEGGDEVEADASLELASAIGPGAFVGGDLVFPVIHRVEKEAQLFLIRVDSRGNEIWQSYIGSSRSPNFLGLGSESSPPTVHGSAIFLVTNHGFVTSIDSIDGSINWLCEYPRLAPRGARESVRDEMRWHCNPALLITSPAEPTRLLAAPQDSPFLLAIDTQTGAIRWRSQREGHSTLIGHDGKLAFVAGTQLSAFELGKEEFGRTVWSTSLVNLSSSPQGRGRLLGDTILIPTQSDLLHFDAATGTLKSRDLWAFPGAGGNFVHLDKTLGVVHPGGFLIYNERETERRRVDAFQGDTATLRRVEFRLRSGEVQEALAILEPWLSRTPSPPEPNSPLDRLHMSVSDALRYLAGQQGDPQASARLHRPRVELEHRPTRRVSAAIELALAYEKAERFDLALDNLHRALQYDSPRTEYELDSGFAVPAEAFIRDRLRSLRANHPEATFKLTETRAFEYLEASLKNRRGQSKTSVLYTDILRRFPYCEVARQSYTSLSQHYTDQKDWLNAARHLLDYGRDFSGSSQAVSARLRGANLLYRGGQRAAAKREFLRLRESVPDARIGNDVRGAEQGETVAAYIDRRLSDPGVVDVEVHSRPPLRFPVKMLWRSPADLTSINRVFLEPTGTAPIDYADAFFTQSNEIIECREVDTGLPRWTIHLRMVPGFLLDKFVSEFYFARAGSKLIQGHFSRGLLVLHDHRNVFAVDLSIGKVRWHHPIGSVSTSQSPLRSRRLTEQIRAVRVTPTGVFVTTSKPQLLGFTLDKGEKLFAEDLEVQPSRSGLLASSKEVFVIETRRASKSQKILTFDAKSGQSTGELQVGPIPSPRDIRSIPIGTEAVQIGSNALIPFDVGRDFELHMVDLDTKQTTWSTRRQRNTLKGLFYFDTHTNEVIATINRENNWPALVGFGLDDGRELWRYENFDARRLTISVFRDDSMVYAIYGSDQLQLLGLRVSQGENRGRVEVDPQWNPPSISLGTFFVSSRERKVLVSADAAIFPDSNTISIFDKKTGQSLTEAQISVSQFLVDKGNFTASVVSNRLVVLSDGGDCAFGDRSSDSVDMLDLVRDFLGQPDKFRTIVPLALGLFQQNSVQHLYSALELLDHALISEEFLLSQAPGDKDKLEILLDGLKEEAMKLMPAAQIDAPRLRTAPSIDGELDDSWSYAHRVTLASPRYIGRIANPGRGRDWEGEEDLSGILYTGWDDDYFYFALDVEDDVLRAFDRDADNWKGDCLIIGVDPDGDGGYRQGPTDQLMTLALTVPGRNQQDKDDDEEGEPGENGEQGENEDEDPKKNEKDKDSPEGEFSVKKKDDNSGAIYEVALPWNTFGTRFGKQRKPQRGVTFGLSLLLIDDDDGKGATKTLSINPCHLLPASQKRIWIWKYLIPEFFPKIMLR